MPTCILRILLLTGAALSLVAQPALGQATPPPLDGEVFSTGAHVVADFPDCPAGRFTFDAAGPATGPYPGTYGESGNNLSGAYQLRFTLASSPGDVVGVKRPAGPEFPELLDCVSWGAQSDNFAAEARYEALIRTDAGVFLERGLASWGLDALPAALDPNDDYSEFSEGFYGADPQPTPFTKQDCKKKQHAQLVASIFAAGTKDCRDFVKGKHRH